MKDLNVVACEYRLYTVHCNCVCLFKEIILACCWKILLNRVEEEAALSLSAALCPAWDDVLAGSGGQ